MRLARVAAGLVLLLGCISFPLHAQSKKITVPGKLTRTMAIGGETSGWSIHFDSETIIDGKPLQSLEVTSSDPKTLESLENKTVKAEGKRTCASGVETGKRPVLSITSIKEIKVK
jgi:hypothetical protein